jgi:CubicO group peptidase (beta-lactamase class C family)
MTTSRITVGGGRLVRIAAIAVALLLLAAIPAGAQGTGPIDIDGIGGFVDAAVVEQMEANDIPGATFVMVADGEIALATGYGHTDLTREVAVDPARTRFDIGSVSKLFTATAVMQQVEQGRMDLDADVNDYLNALQVPDTFPEPVTAAHLLTHTAGFAERFFVGMVATGPGEDESLADSLARDLPPRIRPPGVTHQYNNQGMALAGHLVERTSGRPFEQYVTESILDPLGMTRTTYGQPPRVEADDAVPHSAMAGPTAAVEPWYVNLLPAGGLWTTGEDIASFMLAHLQDGQHRGARILRPDTVRTMHGTQFRPHPEVPGLAYGFFEHGPAGRRGLQHGGQWIGTGAHLYLLPDEGVGLFLVANHEAAAQFVGPLIHDVVDRFFPTPAADLVAPAAAADTGMYAGQYRWNRQDRSTFMRLVSTVFLGGLEVRPAGDGALETEMSPALMPRTRWIQTSPGTFLEEGGTNTLVFDVDGGRVSGLHVMGAQLFSMQRLAWYESTALTLALLALFVGVLVVAALAWPAGAAYRRLRRRDVEVPRDLRLVRRVSGLAAAVSLAFVVGFALHFAVDWPGMLQLSATLRGLLVVPFVAAALSAALAYLVVRLWRRRTGSTAGRVWHTGIAVVLLAYLPFLYQLRLLGFHY